MTPEEIIKQRGHVHGDWKRQSRLAWDMKVPFAAVAYGKLPPHQYEAIEMILNKISRICSGDASHADHWDDIAGYALLGKKGHDHD